MTQKVRIETKFGEVGTKVLNENGELLVSHITNVEFRHRVGDVPRMVIERLATDVVIEGEVEMEIVTLCACCKRELENESRQGDRSSQAVADATSMNDGYRKFVPAPSHKK